VNIVELDTFSRKNAKINFVICKQESENRLQKGRCTMKRMVQGVSFVGILFMMTASYAFAQSGSSSGMTASNMVLILVLPALVLIAYIVGCWKYHKFCLEEFEESPFRMGAVFALSLANVILGVAVVVSILRYTEAHPQQAGLDMPSFLIGLGIWIAITGVTLWKNIQEMDVKHGIIGTVLVLFGSILIFVVYLFYSRFFGGRRYDED
jgi:hypothetical protein